MVSPLSAKFALRLYVIPADHLYAGILHLLNGLFTVSFVELDAAHAFFDQVDIEIKPSRIKCSVFDAVVSCQAHDIKVIRLVLAEDVFQAGGTGMVICRTQRSYFEN